MWQEVFRIPFINRPVYGYGLMLVIGFLCAAQLARYLAQKCRLNGEHFVNAGLIALVTGVIGARLSHIFESLADPQNTEFARNGHPFFWDNFVAMLNVTSGGLTFYGGFLLATPILMWYAIRKRIPLLTGMDIIAPCLMVGLAFGRIGCFFNGCCYGAECTLPWGASFPYGSNAFVEQYENREIAVPAELTDPTQPLANGLPRLLLKNDIESGIHRLEHLTPQQKERNPGWEAELEHLKTAKRLYPTLTATLRAKPVQPTELYSTFNSFLVAGILLAYFSLAPAPGRVFGLMLILEGASRFILEMIRVEPAVWGRMSFSMVLGLAFTVMGVLMWWGCGRRQNKSGGRIVSAPA